MGPLPQIPQNDVVNISGFSRRVSRASEIYEEIFEGSQFLRNESGGRRFSRGSIASGIYEEMKPTASNFHAIMEEMSSKPPPLPPLPPIRKRINTYETENLGLLGDIPRSNTNPESELAKKKKYINVVHNIFSGRSKRAESVSETVACSVEQIISSDQATYANDTTNKHSPQLSKPLAKLVEIAKSKRNSFSSPDLSKINFLDTFDEEKVAEFMLSNSSGEIDLSSKSLNESSIKEAVQSLTQKAESFESLNISEQIPQNFNFSACNSSSINLMGSNGAALLATQTLRKKNKIIMDMNGYCLMAPIKNNASCKNPVTLVPIPAVTGTESTSSGYSTGSYCSSNDDNNTVTNLAKENKLKLLNAPPTEDSNIYENMHGSLNSTGKSVQLKPVQLTEAEFTGNLYENLLAVKAAQELEQSPLLNALSTSTPTDSPLLNQMDTQTTPGSSATKQAATVEEEENYYQTPRKSIISVDDKIPSYYPNSCETLKTTRRKSNSPQLKSKSRRRSEGAEEQITPSTTPTTHIEVSNENVHKIIL